VDATSPQEEARQATTLAEEAATAAGVRVRDLHEPAELTVASALLDSIWGREPDQGPMLAPEALIALAHAGGQVIGAFAGEDLVGATVAFVGLSERGTPHLHSHVTGVTPQVAGQGVGRALKLHQRAWCLHRGVTTVRWTFDPLVRRNAVFNLVTLGALATAYQRDVYGPMSDARNAGLPTDRLVAVWELTGPRTRQALTGRRAEPDVAAVRRSGAAVVVDVGEGEMPVVTPSDAPRRLVRVPADVEALRARDPALARRWSHTIREHLGDAMDAGMRVTGVARDGWYVLAAPRGVEELAEQR
jgi:predicted GNAT superfamily acetyltransferase